MRGILVILRACNNKQVDSEHYIKSKTVIDSP